MSTELKQIIVDLRKRVDILTKELKTLRSSLSKMNNRRQNPYKWNRYYNHDKQEKNTKNQTKPHEKNMIKENCQPNLKNEKFDQRKSKLHDKIHESSKSKKPEPMEIDKLLKEKSCKSTKLEPMEVDKSLNQKSFKSHRPEKSKFESKLGQEQVISILKNKKSKRKEQLLSNHIEPIMQPSRQQATEPLFEAKTKTTEGMTTKPTEQKLMCVPGFT